MSLVQRLKEMRYFLALGAVTVLALLFAGCGEVTEAMDAMDSGSAGAGGTASMGGAGGGMLGGSTAGAGDATGTGGAGGTPACVENTRIECRNVGVAIVTAQYACHDDGYNEQLWGACENGKLTGYYEGLSCPFDVGITTAAGWTGPAPESTGGIITNMGGSTSTVWRNTEETIYCCDGNTVRKIARCR